MGDPSQNNLFHFFIWRLEFAPSLFFASIYGIYMINLIMVRKLQELHFSMLSFYYRLRSIGYLGFKREFLDTLGNFLC